MLAAYSPDCHSLRNDVELCTLSCSGHMVEHLGLWLLDFLNMPATVLCLLCFFSLALSVRCSCFSLFTSLFVKRETQHILPRTNVKFTIVMCSPLGVYVLGRVKVVVVVGELLYFPSLKGGFDFSCVFSSVGVWCSRSCQTVKSTL